LLGEVERGVDLLPEEKNEGGKIYIKGQETVLVTGGITGG